jgi:UDP-N-acetylglucosamine 4,6-dehydratase/5-epimerase
MLNGKTILLTGGTGSFGNRFVKRVFEEYEPKKVIIYSRDEFKQYTMRSEFKKFDGKTRYFIGDVRDFERLKRALDGVDCVVHAAALKQVLACEYNPIEAIKTNIHGAQNLIDAAIDKRVEQVVALSTDKAVNPVNLYGATKLASDKLFVAANAYAGQSNCKFSVVRYGNVSASRGSVIPFFKQITDDGINELPVTDSRMTRFWISLDEAVDLVFKALSESKGGETYISKIPSFKITDLAKAINPGATLKEIGRREGEKIHECLITEYDSFHAYEYEKHYIVYPNFEWWSRDSHFTEGGTLVGELFEYSSNNNKEWLSIEQLREKLNLMEL